MKLDVHDRIDRLRQLISGAADVPSLLLALEELRGLEPDQEVGDGLDEGRLDAMDALTRLTQSDPGTAGRIIIEHLLPLCLRTKTEWRDPSVAHRYDEALSGWLDRFPAIHRFAPRAKVLEMLVGSLDGDAAERACRLIGMLGYRDERASARLLELARTGEEAIRDVALHALSALGVSPSLRPTLEQLSAERVGAGLWNYDLVGAAGRTISPGGLDLIFAHWLTPANLQTDGPTRGFLPHLTMAVPAAVAQRYPDDAGLQDLVWDRLLRLERTAPVIFFQRVLGSDQVAPPFDSPGVVRYYLSILGGDAGSRDLVYVRLEACILPRQMLGWQEPPGTELVSRVLTDAGAPSAMEGAFMTQDLRRKLQAWQTLLSLGRNEALASLVAAMPSERSGHALGAILDLAACFHLDPLPTRVCDLIAGAFGDIAEDESERVTSHIGAVAVARASESSSALETLLKFDLVREGGVLISLLDALADTASALTRAGDGHAVERLWEATESSRPEYRRTAAAAAIGRLVRRGLLQPPPTERLVALVEDETLDRYARRAVLEALGHIPIGEAPPEIAGLLRRTLAGPSAATGGTTDPPGAGLRPVALAALACSRQSLTRYRISWDCGRKEQPGGTTAARSLRATRWLLASSMPGSRRHSRRPLPTCCETEAGRPPSNSPPTCAMGRGPPPSRS